jgi:two-component system, OmpR family, response regulator QseB
MHILLIEDDLDLGRALQGALKVEGLTSEWVRRIVDAPNAVDMNAIDCVLLDMNLPDGDGASLLSRWRSQGMMVPVIVISARSSVDDRLAGLDSGADDFVVKPFATAELISRIRAVLRRVSRQATDVWQIGDLQIEPRTRRVSVAGSIVELSPREFQLILELARDPGRVISKGLLSQRLDPLGDPVDFASIEVHLSNLRRKIGADHIRTIRGVGYMLVNPC